MCLVDLKLAAITRSALSILHFLKKVKISAFSYTFVPHFFSVYCMKECTVCCIANQNQLEAK
jgi:hypothetical protein